MRRQKKEWNLILSKVKSKANYLSESILGRSAYTLLWPLLLAPTPFETGLDLPEVDELEAEAEVEEAPCDLITAARL